MEKGPSYQGSGLVNLVAEIERRLIGSSPFPGLEDPGPVPDGETFVLAFFDGLGVDQLDHPAGRVLRSALAGTLDAPFPTTTTVSLATVATGLSPSQHGQVAHLSWYPDLGQVVNTLKWVTLGGEHVPYEYGGLLPRPNLWERLRTAGLEPITVQPGDFEGSPLSRLLYRGARFEPAWDANDLIDATITLAAEPGRLIFTYVPFVDVAGHLFGQGSDEFAEAMKSAALIWEGLAAGLARGVTLLGTADHGLMELSESDKYLVREPRFDSLRFAGDTRGLHVWGDPAPIRDLAEATGGELVGPTRWLGPNPTEGAMSHLGDTLLMAAPGTAIIPRGFDKRLRCYHGGLMREEVEIPLLVG